jgi:hypothetical protein
MPLLRSRSGARLLGNLSLRLPKLEVIGTAGGVDADLGPPLSRRTWWLVLALSSVALLAPLGLTPLPPLLDYPNHLARMVVLERGAADPVLSAMYAVDWHVVPNIAIDVLMPPLLHVLPLDVAGRLFIALALLLPFTGAVVLHRSLFGRRTLWPFAAVLVVYNHLLFAGFLNYLIGLGAALLGAALWVRMAPRPVARSAVATVVATGVFFCHIIALAAYGLLLFAIEAADWWDRPAGLRWRVASIAGPVARLAVPFVIPALLYLHSQLAGASGGLGWSIRWKLRGVFGPFMTYYLGLDLLAILAVVGLIGWCWWRGHLLVARAGALGLAILLVLYPLMPFGAAGTGYVDQRLPPMAGLLLFAATLPHGLAPSLRRIATAALAAIAVARLAGIGLVWAGHNADLAAFRQVIAGIRPAERVLPVQIEAADVPQFHAGQPRSRFVLIDQPSIEHLPALVLIEHDAFFPLLFTAAAKQPLRVRDAYAGSAAPEGLVPSYRELAVAAAGGPLPRDAPYLAHWQRDFDYVLLLYAGKLAAADRPLLPDILEPVRQADIAALYRIRHPQPQRAEPEHTTGR